MTSKVLAAGFCAVATGFTLVLLADPTDSSSRSLPYPKSGVIGGIELDWSTHQRFAQGSDNFQLAWASDNHLYGAWGDGGGFGGTNREGRVGLGVARIEGSATNYQGYNLWGGSNARNRATFDGKSWGMICVDSTLFMWVVPDKPEGKDYRNHYEYIELARSDDLGNTWSKADWKFHQSEDLTIPTFLSFGRNHTGVPADFGSYVYSYFIKPQSREMEQQGPNGQELIVHKPGVLYLSRVREDRIFAQKSAHEFFSGFDSRGNPEWGQIDAKVPVFEDPDGVGWCLAASYNPFFQRVLLTTQHDGNAQGTLGMFDAPTPWGPWTTVAYFDRAAPFGEQRNGSDLAWRNNVFFIAFATKWFDGNAFTLNFTGAGRGKDNDSFNTVQGRFLPVNKFE